MAGKISRQELVQKLEEIDRELSAEQVKLTARPFEAHSRVAKILGLRSAVLLGPNGPSPLFREIAEWYERRYGNRMLVDFKIGKKPILLRGLLCYIRFPVVYGSQTVPILEQVEGLTKDMAQSLTQGEVESITGHYMAGWYAFASLDSLRSVQLPVTGPAQDYVRRGLHDLDAAVSLAETVGDSQGSVFHAQQAAEKFLKAALAKYGVTEKEIKSLRHDLAKALNRLVKEDQKFAYIAEAVMAVNWKSMDIRYKDHGLPVERVVSAVDAALHVCSFVADQWRLESMRGSTPPKFEPGRFYTNSMGLNYKCIDLEIDDRGIELAELALLDNNGIDAVFKQRSYYSFLYAEIKDLSETERLERRYKEVVLGGAALATGE